MRNNVEKILWELGRRGNTFNNINYTPAASACQGGQISFDVRIKFAARSPFVSSLFPYFVVRLDHLQVVLEVENNLMFS